MLIIFFLLNLTNSCKINGVEGICISKNAIIDDLKLCYEYVSEYICVPYFSVLFKLFRQYGQIKPIKQFHQK